MNVTINEFYNHPVLTYGKTRIRKIIIAGETLNECYHKIYQLEKSARYNNYLYYHFIDSELEKNYWKWKQDSITIDLYYGNSTVD